jgi:PAS domain S-box-containing protein
MKPNCSLPETVPTSSLAHDQVLRLFLDSITDQAVFTVDPNGVITTWNAGCQQVKGYSSAEAIGQNFSILYTVSDRMHGRPADNLRVARAEGQFHEERDRVRKGNEIFMAEISIYPIEEKGVITGFAKIVKDVSERTRMDEQRRLFEKELRRSNEELEGFSQSVAHDLRTPIRAIVTRCKIMVDDFTPVLPKDVLSSLELLEQRSLKLMRVVDDLLQFSRLGHGSIKRHMVDVSALASRVAAEVVPQSHHRSASFEIQAGMVAEAEPEMLELLLRNLIENSYKYSKPDVHVKVLMDLVKGQQVFEVRDDGVGFDIQHAESIFEPFIRLHREDAVSGTGLGLANVKRIVLRHHGNVWAKSETGKGASFFFTLGGNRAVTHLRDACVDLQSHRQPKRLG